MEPTILEVQSCTIRKIARAVGLMLLNFPAVTSGPLHYRELDNDNGSKGPQMGL